MAASDLAGLRRPVEFVLAGQHVAAARTVWLVGSFNGWMAGSHEMCQVVR